jgi:hypothetical protein
MAINQYMRQAEGAVTGPGGFRPGRILALVVVLIGIIVAVSLAGNLVENASQNEIMVIESARTGELTWFASGGLHGQWFGKVTKYPKRGIYEFKTPVRFNDGGHGTLEGSVQFEMPLDSKNLSAIYTRYPDEASLRRGLIETVANKAVYMTGPLMSSKESYAEKRNDLIRYVEDQIDNGVYQTRQREVKVRDELANQDKTAIVAEIVMVGGAPARQEGAILKEFGIRSFNFSVKALPYDDVVESQIKAQQAITMQVQTAIAEARQAEQKKITVELQGQAQAAQAKWEQEVIKAKEVTGAEQRLAVARLANQEADQYKETQLKKADADATYRRRIMEADGALEKKLATYLQAQQVWAQAFASYKGALVPSVVMGGGAGQGQNAATTFMDMLGVKFARDMALDFAPRPAASHGGGQ